MKIPLSIPDKDIQQVVAEQFDIKIQRLDFVPIGENSWLYKATDATGQLLAVKVQEDDNPAVDEARRRLVQSNYSYMPKIHMTKDGKVQAPMGELYVSVEEYIEHDSAKAHDSIPGHDYLVTLGKALRSLHDIKVSPVDNNGPIPVETFRPMFLAPAKESITIFTEWSANKPEAQAIMNVLTERVGIIEKLFARSVELGAVMAGKQLPLMLTHGDIHFGNTLETKDGKFYLIDWDSTMIGGVGHDLMYFSDAQLADISLGYGNDLLADRDNLQYYRNHLMLRFIWFWLNKAMSANSAEDLQAIAGTFMTAFDENSDYLMRALDTGTDS